MSSLNSSDIIVAVFLIGCLFGIAMSYDSFINEGAMKHYSGEIKCIKNDFGTIECKDSK